MKIFITGATGFIGSWLVRHFAARGWVVCAAGRSDAPPALRALATDYLCSDIRRPLPVREVDAVVHAAALTSDTATAAALQAANVDGVRHVYEATRESPVFVYVSSSSVYAYHPEAHAESEMADYAALSPYGRSKRLAEDWLLRQDWSRRTLIVLRPRAVYGPGDRVLLPRLLQLVRGRGIFLPGDMRVLCSLTHVDNLCAAVSSAVAFAQKRPGGVHVFNVADAAPYVLREAVLGLLSGVYGRELAVTALPLAPLRRLGQVMEWLRLPGPFTRFGLAAASQPCVLDTQGIARVLGFIPEQNLWRAIPNIGRWVNTIGLTAVRAASACLPWHEAISSEPTLLENHHAKYHHPAP